MTDNLNDKNETPELIARRQAGNDGNLWRVKVLCKSGNATIWRGKENMYSHEVMDMREGIFKSGFMIWMDPGHWLVIPPFDILEVHVYKQSKYFIPTNEF